MTEIEKLQRDVAAAVVPKRERRLLRIAALADMLGVSEMTLQRWQKSGALPPSIRLGPKCVCWDSEVIDAWIAEKAKAA